MLSAPQMWVLQHRELKHDARVRTRQRGALRTGTRLSGAPEPPPTAVRHLTDVWSETPHFHQGPEELGASQGLLQITLGGARPLDN